MKVSVLIPTKNEPLINKLIKEVHKELANYDHEIIVIDKSDVPPKIQRAKLILQQSDGLGNAILEGSRHAKRDIIVTMDADCSHRPKDIIKLLERINGYDIVIGSRFAPGGKTLDKTHRKIISLLSRKFASLILVLRVRDSMSGFIAVKKEIFRKLQLNPMGYKINMEIMFKARKKGYKTVEAPIIFLPRKKGGSKIKGIKILLEGLNLIRYILELRLGLR